MRLFQRTDCARGRSAFTLVELLVVIAIIGILIALLLPAVQAAREAARNMQCKNQERQMITAFHNHENQHQIYPTGGDRPWPAIENYRIGGSLNPADKMGLSWAFQILPYMEKDAYQDITTTAELRKADPGTYFCPSRRQGERYSNNLLMDYAGAVPGNKNNARHENSISFWVGHDRTSENYDADRLTIYEKKDYRGVITRISWWHTDQEFKGGRNAVKVRDITDGLSHTIVIGEKAAIPSQYQAGDWCDDCGWTDGWDPDTMRSTTYRPEMDQERLDTNDPCYRFGAAHPGGFNCAFADGSVRSIAYDVDPMIFNYLGNRMDGETIPEDELD